jgi:hypothetical protein
VLLDVATKLETIASEVASSKPKKSKTTDNLAPDVQNYLQRFGKTASPAMMIISNPKFTVADVLRKCPGVPAGTARGLRQYFSAAFQALVEEKLNGHPFAARWLADATPRRTRAGSKGAMLSIARLTLRNPTATDEKLAELCKRRKIEAAKATIVGTRRYTHLAWRLARASS